MISFFHSRSFLLYEDAIVSSPRRISVLIAMPIQLDAQCREAMSMKKDDIAFNESPLSSRSCNGTRGSLSNTLEESPIGDSMQILWS